MYNKGDGHQPTQHFHVKKQSVCMFELLESKVFGNFWDFYLTQLQHQSVLF